MIYSRSLLLNEVMRALGQSYFVSFFHGALVHFHCKVALKHDREHIQMAERVGQVVIAVRFLL